VGGTFISASDARLKTDITPLNRVLDKVLRLEPKTYQYSATVDANRHSFGFIAQEVEKLFPDFVFTSENGIKELPIAIFR
jgi:hypothetical protein